MRQYYLLLLLPFICLVVALPVNLTGISIRESIVKRLSRSNIQTRCSYPELLWMWRDRRDKHIPASKSGVIVWNCRTGGGGCGGNGDRMRGIVGALYNAIRTGYGLSIQWNNPVDMGQVLLRTPFLDDFNDAFTFSPTKLEATNTLTVDSFDQGKLKECEWGKYEKIMLRSNELLPTNCHESDSELKPFFFEDTQRVNDKLWQRFPCLGCAFWLLFTLSHHLERAVHAEMERFQAWSEARNRTNATIIAMHFRGGDHYMNISQEFEKRMELTALHEMITCADTLAQTLAPQTRLMPPTIILCADSVAAKQFAVQNHPERVYTSSTVPFHTDRQGSDFAQGTIGSWVDLILLGFADGIVLSRSGYSILAAQIGMYAGNQIVTSADCLTNVKR